MAIQSQQNPYGDRITEILQRRATQAQTPINPFAQEAAGRAAIYHAGGITPERGMEDIISAIRAPKERAIETELQSAQGLYEMFEMQRQQGSKEAQQVADVMGMITTDPAGQAQLLEALHADPEELDPNNRAQLLRKVAGYAKDMGIETDFARNKRMADLDLRSKQLDVQTKERALSAPAAPKLPPGVKLPKGMQPIFKDGVFVGVEPMQGIERGGYQDPFAGTGMDAQTMNILLNPEMDTSSPIYLAAYNRMAQPKVTVDPTTNAVTTVTPDMSAYRKPTVGGVELNGEELAPGVKRVGPKKFTEGQVVAAGYADRMRAAGENLARLEAIGETGVATMASVMSGLTLGKLPKNVMLTDEQQLYLNSARDWVRAKLRKESGAVIGDDEMQQEIETYFPVLGDSDAVIAQKRQARDLATRGMERAAGPSYEASPVVPSVPQGAIDYLKSNPNLRDAFDQKYGAGAAASVLGE